ncbi:hypothetical protein Vadar_026740 [Vaccinium darrowii]|uniref:Uncharacterized protein n=1 Tax=Vaccinium darrowii TaxID=229202 RepID=A0ACB7Y203_9ERIC|nr:hypothetical protein Vadar_026740 [Vaccinium darrowii]
MDNNPPVLDEIREVDACFYIFDCLIEAKSTYALKPADLGLSNMSTNLCLRIVCRSIWILLRNRDSKATSSYVAFDFFMFHSAKPVSTVVVHHRRTQLWPLNASWSCSVILRFSATEWRRNLTTLSEEAACHQGCEEIGPNHRRSEETPSLPPWNHRPSVISLLPPSRNQFPVFCTWSLFSYGVGATLLSLHSSDLLLLLGLILPEMEPEEEDLASDWPENCVALGRTAERKIFFWDWRTKKQIACLEESHMDDFSVVIMVQFVPDHQNKLLSASVDGLMCIFDARGSINDDDHLESMYLSTIWKMDVVPYIGLQVVPCKAILLFIICDKTKVVAAKISAPITAGISSYVLGLNRYLRANIVPQGALVAASIPYPNFVPQQLMSYLLSFQELSADQPSEFLFNFAEQATSIL